MKAKTSFANGINPFAAPPAPPAQAKREKPVNLPVDFSQLSMSNDPLPAHKQSAKRMSKYAPLLEKMQAGECVKCPRENVVFLVKSMSRLVGKHYPDYVLRSVMDYGDGMGRVWMLPKPEKLKVKA